MPHPPRSTTICVSYWHPGRLKAYIQKACMQIRIAAISPALDSATQFAFSNRRKTTTGCLTLLFGCRFNPPCCAMPRQTGSRLRRDTSAIVADRCVNNVSVRRRQTLSGDKHSEEIDLDQGRNNL